MKELESYHWAPSHLEAILKHMCVVSVMGKCDIKWGVVELH